MKHQSKFMFSFKKMHLNMSFAKCQPYCIDLYMLMHPCDTHDTHNQICHNLSLSSASDPFLMFAIAVLHALYIYMYIYVYIYIYTHTYSGPSCKETPLNNGDHFVHAPSQ